MCHVRSLRGSRFNRPVRLLLGFWHWWVFCRPPLHRKQRFQGEHVYLCVVCCDQLTSLPRFSMAAPPTKRSSLATEFPPTTPVKAVCPASCGTGRRPSASRQMNAIHTPLVLVPTRPLAWNISSILALSVRTARTSTHCLFPARPAFPTHNDIL